MFWVNFSTSKVTKQVGIRFSNSELKIDRTELALNGLHRLEGFFEIIRRSSAG
jgi:hypothetical protein